MPKSKVDTRAVLGGGPDEVGHYPGDVEGQLAFGLGWYVCVPTGGGRLGSRTGIYLLHSAFPLGLLVYGSLLPACPLGLDLLLPPSLEVGSQRQRLNNFPRVPQAAGHVQDGLVADDVGEAVDLPEQLGFDAVDVLSLPQPGCH